MTAPRHQSLSSSTEPSVTMLIHYLLGEDYRIGPLARSATFDRSGEQTANKIPLQGKKDDNWDKDAHEGGSCEYFPFTALRAEQSVQRARQDKLIPTRAEKDHGDQKVVPGPEELENGEGGECR